MSRTRRRVVLALVVALCALTAPLGSFRPEPAVGQAPAPLSVFVISVDSLRPSEIDPVTTPNLARFRSEGTGFAQSRSSMIAETIPTHVAMMTGVYPARNGIPANSYWDRTSPPTAQDLSNPAELTAATLFTTLDRACPGYRTASVLSKKYLFEIFSTGGRNRAADFHWDPRPTNIPGSEHSPDVETMRVATSALPNSDFMFVNLGDVDRVGHTDVSGPLQAGATRRAALTNTDRLLGDFFNGLRASGRWANGVVLVLSDHGMDWSTPDRFINLAPTLPVSTFTVQNGGADTVYLRSPRAPNAGQVLRTARRAALAHPGVDRAWYRQPNPADTTAGSVAPAALGLNHPNAGDLIVTAKPGWRFSDPKPTSNPLPGNHGHLVTRHNTMMVGGGAPFVRRGRTVLPSVPNPSPLQALPEQSETVDVAPTVAWLLGQPTTRYSGRVLGQAFTTRTAPTACGAPRAPSAPAA